jgi:hypothetical protein
MRALPLAAIILSIICQPGPAGAEGLVVHEWGTFTSFQGGDGAPLAWQPLQTSRLPGFVYNWSRPGSDTAFSGLPGFGGKFSLVTKQRLETPVVYFYSDTAQTVDLTVKFPNGWITEWYPRADRISQTNQDSLIQWSNIDLLPAAHRRDLASHPATSPDPYFAARDTDSDFVKSKNETEKFLFYRGAGNFTAPLRVSMKSDAAVVLANTGRETIPHIFLFQVDDLAGNFISVPELKPGEERTVFVPLTQKRWFSPGDELAGAMGKSMAKALVQSGLYPREANAMVNTWKDSWFKEKGLRVFYVLPRAWTDGALPMTLNPTPGKLVRVMVGRAEIFPPGMEQNLVQQLKKAYLGDASARTQALDLLKTLGRFSEPAMNHALIATHLKPEEQGKLLGLLYSSSAFE